MGKKRWTYGLVALFFASAFWSSAQEESRTDIPRVEARLSTDSIWIGDQFTLEVVVEKDMMQVIDFPTFQNDEGKIGTIGDKVEVLLEYPVDTLERDGRSVKIRKRYLLTAFDAGHYNLGRFSALSLDKNVVDTLYPPDSLRFHVQTF